LKEDKVILEEAKKCFERAYTTNYPEDFSANSWWKRIQDKNSDLINGFETSQQTVSYAQNGQLSGFDHRKEEMRSVIEFKLQELRDHFPGFSMGEHPELRESPYSNQDTVEEFDGVPYSNIFLYHTNFYLRSSSTFASPGSIKKAIEIGTGYGALARIFKIMDPGISYTMIDFPEMLFFAHNYLSLNFPDAKILYLDEDNQHEMGEEFDFILVPIQRFHLLKGQSFEFAINTGSLQEMTGEAVAFWMDFIENQIQVDGFYSCNYFLKLGVWSQTSATNLMCPVLDSFWKAKYFRINPPVISVDANRVNWLELCLERIPAEKRDATSLKIDAAAMTAEAKQQTKGSDSWFENLWMSIWSFPTQESINEMLDGIRVCRQVSDDRNLVKPQSVDLPFWRRRVAQVLRVIARGKPIAVLREIRVFTRGRSLIEGNQYYEEKFYRKMLAELQ